MNSLDSQNDAATPAKGRLLIVDDDPVAAGMLGLMLKKHGYEVRSAASGEACLLLMADFTPEVVLLDIEMPGGMNGYATCAHIREHFDHANLTIIFLSGHDSLEERLKAYDIGGDDFVAKPFEAEELRCKIVLAVSARLRRGRLVEEQATLKETVDIAMQSYAEIGSLLKFVRGALCCRTLLPLAGLIISSMRSVQADCHVHLCGSNTAGSITLTAQGLASPLEESVIERMRAQGRMFQFKSRMIINYPHVSVLVTNMPAADEVAAGRLRDNVAMIAEAAEDAVANISLRAEALAQVKALQNLAESVRDDIAKIHLTQRAQRLDTRCELERMAERIEAMYYKFGLSDLQEAAITQTVLATNGELLRLFAGHGADLEKQFASIRDGLDRASSYRV